MKNILDPVRQSVKEIRTLWNARRTEGAKPKLFGLIYFNLLFVFMYSVLLAFGVFYIGIGIFVHPNGFLGLVAPIPGLLVAYFIRMKVYPKAREKAVKQPGWE
ncbi:hypothetical protein LCM20_09135 [Halobacillus litoralis]|uniref:hypothetical protein n=1 Tax=Halobacillus litoralis TaxID=45668 RepID=UPI001CD3C4B2|nr:hypothetical protein [Halobacillus litoralis]MCA0970751.1 hypothetical protein [Halobacillus litoralis]